ncbi:3375_t:CDS:1, partial [Cetraspora pellucida]
KDYSIQDSEVKNFIAKRQIYDEFTTLRYKLALLAAKFCLTHIAAMLQDLIQQIEQANSDRS